jgi:hypothetical protein
MGVPVWKTAKMPQPVGMRSVRGFILLMLAIRISNATHGAKEANVETAASDGVQGRVLCR